MSILKSLVFRYKLVRERIDLINKKIRNRIPENIKEFAQRQIFPYASIILVAAFVFIASLVHASENYDYVPNTEVMNLDPDQVAQVVNAVNPYTPNYEEDSVQVVLAVKNEDYVGKPMIAETAKTETPEENRKSTIAYKVESGDTLSKIGWKYGLTIATIKAINGLSSDNIRLGQELKLPPSDLSPSYLASLQAKRVAGASSKKAFTGTFGRPTSGWNLSQYFGHTSFENWHTGIDLTSRSGTNIYASASGTVAKVGRGWGGGYGNHIVINHGNGFSTLYGHLSQIRVNSGQWVNQGQLIGIMGSTGWSTGTHLHFEIRVNGVAKNPLDYL